MIVNMRVSGQIPAPLLVWYDGNKRELPWREQKNAYRTWVSEIMLQQTRVETVKPYFARFIHALPDIASLAGCPEDRLLKLWEGLGYYSRVRNMQYAARTVMEQYNGLLPASFEELLKLKGIGRYTAGAIASIAYGLPVPAVDGNVLRVTARLADDHSDIMSQTVRLETERALAGIIPHDRPGDFNQAMMDLGAMVCIPGGEAHCDACPLSRECLAHRAGTVSSLPFRPPKKKQRIEERTVFVIVEGSHAALRKRPDKGLLAGLYELPNTDGHLSQDDAVRYVKDLLLEPLYIERLPDARHVFSHIEWHMTGYLVRVSSLDKAGKEELLFLSRREIRDGFAIPSAFSAYIPYLKEDNT
ncbi:MAG: A/G-specific adenine glycosylase [Blautia sp.]|nr:A/G-specific adenine glycosylase [Blautia sp.]